MPAMPDNAAPRLVIDHRLDYTPWRVHLPRAEAVLAVAAAQLALPMAELSLVWLDDAAMTALNAQYRGKPAPTNVLAFAANDAAEIAPQNNAPLMLGDIVLAYQTMAREAKAAGRDMADHLAHLLVHGLLHLLGFDHQSAPQAAAMEKREIALLAACGVSNPYAEAANE